MLGRLAFQPRQLRAQHGHLRVAIGEALIDRREGRLRYRGLRDGLLCRHLVQHRLQHRRIDPSALLDRTEQQQPVSDLVDVAGNAAASLEQLGEQLLVELRVAVPAGTLQPVEDVALDLALLSLGSRPR